MIDESTAFGERVARHLREDRIVWLTTVTPGGAPVPSPVWFWWDGAETVHLFSLPDTPRLRNLRSNPKVSLNFAGDGYGGDIVVLSGEASVDGEGASEDHVPAYVEKYGWGFERLKSTPEDFRKKYSAPLRIRLTKVRGH
jgi:PPOX class probable F420-dependent enzyme